MEIDARLLNFWWKDGGLNEAGDAAEVIPGLCAAEVPLKKGAPKGNPCGTLLPADEVGIGGEKGSGGYWFEFCRLGLVPAGDMEGGGAGSSSPNDTPSALSLASLSSLT